MVFHQYDSLTVRPMSAADVDQILHNFAEQGWPKPREVLENYLTGQNSGELSIFIADRGDDVAGYAVLYPCAKNGPFAGKNIPEISDLIVFIKYQHRGIGNKILDEAEKAASSLSSQVSLGVGLHSGYGPAQRIYVQRGYVPDGSGLWYRDAPLEPYADCKNDDDLVLYLSKELRPD